MAYRFLLEVPEHLVADATDAVDRAGDAQVILTRTSHGLGIDDPYMDLTVAAHSLRVVDSLYDWFDELGASRPDIRIVLHGGERIPLESVERGEMVAAIRRDQPRVEHTVPKIGEHMPREGTAGRAVATTSSALATTIDDGRRASGVFVGDVGAIIPSPRRVQITGLNHVAVRVQELPRAEDFYRAFFGMEVFGRAYRDPNGGYRPAPDDYDHAEARRQGNEADVSFLQGGPFTLVLVRSGRDSRIERNALLDHISVSVDSASFATIQAETLVRNFDILSSSDIAIAFRDPFGITWEATVGGTSGPR